MTRISQTVASWTLRKRNQTFHIVESVTVPYSLEHQEILRTPHISYPITP
ncbi:hypothetical protein Hanom_Chr03g00240101 [Helianthus anomalus]